jgi:hypothetical protein
VILCSKNKTVIFFSKRRVLEKIHPNSCNFDINRRKSIVVTFCTGLRLDIFDVDVSLTLHDFPRTACHDA